MQERKSHAGIVKILCILFLLLLAGGTIYATELTTETSRCSHHLEHTKTCMDSQGICTYHCTICNLAPDSGTAPILGNIKENETSDDSMNNSKMNENKGSEKKVASGEMRLLKYSAFDNGTTDGAANETAGIKAANTRFDVTLPAGTVFSSTDGAEIGENTQLTLKVKRYDALWEGFETHRDLINQHMN